MIYSGFGAKRQKKEMTHRFPCQDACASNRWISFFSCQVLQLLTLEAASQKRLSVFLSLRSKPLQSNASSKASLPLMQQLAAQAGLAAETLSLRSTALKVLYRLVATEHEQCNQSLPEGGGLRERTKATNSGFLRKPANSLSRRASLMG
jgi:hypothetical protein